MNFNVFSKIYKIYRHRLHFTSIIKCIACRCVCVGRLVPSVPTIDSGVCKKNKMTVIPKWLTQYKSKLRKLCHCPNSYGPDCIWHRAGFLTNLLVVCEEISEKS